jgi:tetratricopeptide (TPR) repeat protein
MTSGNGGNKSGAASVRDPETDKARLRAIHAALSAGDIESAGKLAEDALADGIDHPMVLSFVAGRRELEGRFADSLELLLRAKAAAPEATGIVNAIGLNLMWLGRHEEAVAEFDAALAIDSGFAPALANRGTAQVALARPAEARASFEAALARDPHNLIALNGLAALALRRGDSAEARRLAKQVTARQVEYPDALATLAGADIADGEASEGEARLRLLLRDRRLQPPERARALGLLGDALDAQQRFTAAFQAWDEGNGIARDHYAPYHGEGRGTLDLVRELTGAIEGRRVAASWGRDHGGPARRHVFLVGFPGSGARMIADMLAGQAEVATIAERDALIDSARQFLGDADDIARLCAAEDAELDPWRAAYWRRVAEAGVDPAGRLFVDAHELNVFKLPLIARLFPEARVLLARRDPRDAVLGAYRERFEMSAPAYQLLTIDGAASLFAATMDMVQATEKAFGLFVQSCAVDKLAADPEAEMRAICALLDMKWSPELADRVATLASGKWRDYAAEMAGVLPMLQRYF